MDTRTRRTILALALVACAGTAHAQGRFDRGRVEHERERYATPHWVYDDRFHHNRYYPARGYVVDVLPPGNVAITFRGAPFWYHGGVWYQRSGPRYVVVQPPLGVIVPALPPGYTIVYGGVPYYYANDVYYAAAEWLRSRGAARCTWRHGRRPAAGASAAAARGDGRRADLRHLVLLRFGEGLLPVRKPVPRRLEKRSRLAAARRAALS